MKQHHEIEEQTHFNVIQAFTAAGNVQDRLSCETLVVMMLSGDSKFATLGGVCGEAQVAALESLLAELKARIKSNDQMIEVANFTLES